MPAGPQPSDGELEGAVRESEWYHTIALRAGVETPGWFDTRSVSAKLPWPNLSGKRCLDIGTFDGFWAFEMEKRGASEVVAIDILDPEQWDWPFGSEMAIRQVLAERKAHGHGFMICARELRSEVRRMEMSVYDLDPVTLGTFDFIYFGSLLLHLRDPVRGLERVRAVCRPDAQLLLVDAIDVDLCLLSPGIPAARLDGLGRPWWYKPNLSGLRRMAEVAGFSVVSGPRPFAMPRGAGQPTSGARPRLWQRSGRERYITWHWGDPHAWLLAEPRSVGPAD